MCCATALQVRSMYTVTTVTTNNKDGQFDGEVYLVLANYNDQTEEIKLDSTPGTSFRKGAADTFSFKAKSLTDTVRSVTVGGVGPGGVGSKEHD